MNNTDLSSQFNYQLDKRISEKLLEQIKNEGYLITGRDSFDAQELNTVFYTKPQSLRCHLCNNLGYEDRDRLVSFHVGNHGREIYFDFETGARLGDDIGINDWFLEGDHRQPE